MWKRVVAGIIVVAATLLILAWWLGWLGEDPALAEVKALQDQLANPNISDDNFRATMDKMRGMMASLSEDSRRAAWHRCRGDADSTICSIAVDRRPRTG